MLVLILFLKYGRLLGDKGFFYSVFFDEEFRREIEFIKKYEFLKLEERDRIFVSILNDK